MSEPVTHSIPETTDQENTLVHVILATYHYRDDSGRLSTSDTLLEGEGWFAEADAARVRADALNAQNLSMYTLAMERSKRDRDAKILAAETANREAAILRANGMPKKDVPVPAAFVPTPFHEFVPEHAYTTYAVKTMTQSEHDVLSASVSDKEPGTDKNTVPDTAGQ